MSIKELRNRYVDLYGEDGVSGEVLDAIEGRLGIILPPAFREVSSFFAGGTIGVRSVLTVSDDPADEWGMVGRTLQMRRAAALPTGILVVTWEAENAVVLDTVGVNSGQLYWLDFQNLAAWLEGADLNSLPKSVYASYADFVAELVSQEEEIRKRPIGM